MPHSAQLLLVPIGAWGYGLGFWAAVFELSAIGSCFQASDISTKSFSSSKQHLKLHFGLAAGVGRHELYSHTYLRPSESGSWGNVSWEFATSQASSEPFSSSASVREGYDESLCILRIPLLCMRSRSTNEAWQSADTGLVFRVIRKIHETREIPEFGRDRNSSQIPQCTLYSRARCCRHPEQNMHSFCSLMKGYKDGHRLVSRSHVRDLVCRNTKLTAQIKRILGS